VNWPETLQDLGEPHGWDPKHFIMTLEARKIAGMKVWTSAYMITGGYSRGGESKEVLIARVLGWLWDKLKADPVTAQDTLEKAAIKLRSPGIGLFLSAQIVADLKHGILDEADDWSTWCAQGPGSLAGLNYLRGKDPKTSMGDKDFRAEINKLRPLVLQSTGLILDAQNLQNCLCETSKFVRIKYYGGRAKSGYTP